MRFLLLLFSLPIIAQVNSGIRYVSSTPSGSCNANAQVRLKTPGGTVYTCQSGTWGAVGGGVPTSLPIGVSITGGTNHCVLFDTSGALDCSANFTFDPNGATGTGGTAIFTAKSGTLIFPHSDTVTAMVGGISATYDSETYKEFDALDLAIAISTSHVGSGADLYGININLGLSGGGDISDNGGGLTGVQSNVVAAGAGTIAGFMEGFATGVILTDSASTPEVEAVYTNLNLFGTSHVTDAHVLRAQVSVNDAGTTITNLNLFQAPAVDGSGAVTTFKGVSITSPTATVTTGYAFWTDMVAASGKWAFYGAGAAASGLNGPLQLLGNVVNPFLNAKNSQSATAPGAGFADLRWIAGTNAGTCKLVGNAGTSATEVTIVDNVGGGC